MCDSCRSQALAIKPLNEGVVGSRMVAYFKANGETPPVEAEYISGDTDDVEINYRFTFPDESVADYKVVYEAPFSLEIVSIEWFNQVI